METQWATYLIGIAVGLLIRPLIWPLPRLTHTKFTDERPKSPTHPVKIGFIRASNYPPK